MIRPKFVQKALFFSAAAMLTVVLSVPDVFAGEMSEVIAARGTVSVSHKGVKTIVQVGTLLYENDTLEMLKNSEILVALDRNRENVISLAGRSQLGVVQINHDQLELQTGNARVLANNQRSYQVLTPNAMAKSSSGQFQVDVDGRRTEIKVIQGSVLAYGRSTQGKIMSKPVMVRAGKKTSVTGYDARAATPIGMTNSETSAVQRGVDDQQNVKDTLERQGHQSSIPEAGEPVQEIGTPRSGKTLI